MSQRPGKEIITFCRRQKPRNEDNENVQMQGPSKRTEPQAVPTRAGGHGRTTQQGFSSAPGRCGPMIKNAGTGDEGDRYDHNIDLSSLEREVIKPSRPTRARNDSRLVDFGKGENSIKPLRFEDPRSLPRSFHGDPRFWLAHQADWYESVILIKKTITTEMRWIDWNYLRSLESPIKEVVEAVYARCTDLGLRDIMRYRGDWNEEVVAQFYATLYVDAKRNVMHWTLGGKRYSISMFGFARMFGLEGVTEERGYSSVHSEYRRLHDGKELNPTQMMFMYDIAYGKGKTIGKINGLTPYYKLLNQLFRFSICPKGGDSENISHRARNLLAAMAPDSRKFSVGSFIWEEIVRCSIDAKSRCHYAPYIFHMIKQVTQLKILPDKEHKSYNTFQGKIEQLLYIGKHATGLDTLAPFPGIHPSSGPGTSRASTYSALPPQGSYQVPSSSRGPHVHGIPKGKNGKLDFIASGIFACFNDCRQNARDIHEFNKWLAEVEHLNEKRYKDILDKFGASHSPIREPRHIASPTYIPNPWEGSMEYFPYGQSEIEEELDIGGGERHQKRGNDHNDSGENGDEENNEEEEEETDEEETNSKEEEDEGTDDDEDGA
jgi:hypothetical protein